MLVADSDRFGDGQPTLALVDLQRGKPRLAGYLPSAAFPRQVAWAAASRPALVTDYGADQLEVLTLPR
jgi:hypothetical protein